MSLGRLVVVACCSVSGFGGWASAAPNAAADSQQKTAVALARANRWSDALVAINEAIKLDPSGPEPVFLRAGIYINLAGASSTLEALAELKQDVDYAAAAQSLGAARADLEAYLKLSPNAPNAGQVNDAIAEVRAREIAATTNAESMRVWRASEKVKADLADEVRLDPVARAIAEDDLTRTSDLGVDLSAGQAEGGVGFGSASGGGGSTPVTGIDLAGRFLIGRNVKVGVELPAGLTRGATSQQALGNVMLDGLWLHDLDPVWRIGLGGGASLPTGTGDRAAAVALATQFGLGAIGAFLPASGVHASADVRMSRASGFGQLQVRFDEILDPQLTIVQLVPGGGIRIGARGAVVAGVPIAAGSALTPWTGSSSVAAALRFGFRFPLGSTSAGGLHVEVPFIGAASAGTFLVSFAIDRTLTL